MLLPPLMSTPRTGGLPAGKIAGAARSWSRGDSAASVGIGAVSWAAFGGASARCRSIAAARAVAASNVRCHRPLPPRPGLSPPDGDMASDPVPARGRQSNF